jgi:hypothetical protein
VDGLQKIISRHLLPGAQGGPQSPLEGVCCR